MNPSNPNPAVPTNPVNSLQWKKVVIAVICLAIVVGVCAFAWHKLLAKQNNDLSENTSGATNSNSMYQGWKTYTSSTEHISFQYPSNWVSTKPVVTSTIPEADQMSIKSPSGDVQINWVSSLTGLGGYCNAQANLGDTAQNACPLISIINKTPVADGAGLFVVSGITTYDGKTYQPWLAVQDSKGLLSNQRSMGYDTYTGIHNGQKAVLFSTSGMYAKGPHLTQAEATAYFNKPEVQQAKLILLSLTY